MAETNLLGRMRRKLNRGDSWLTYDLGRLFTANKLNDNAIEEVEERLLLADAGVEATTSLCRLLRQEVMSGRVKSEQQLREALKGSLTEILSPCERPLEPSSDGNGKPFVLFVAGVNGVGKTTTIGKLAFRYRSSGKRVILAAGDTFRAAAVEQLAEWAQRAEVPLISQGTGADAASVIFDAMHAAEARKSDILIADTAGRLHTQRHLMDELCKIKRVIQKQNPSAPHEVLLVLDATSGANTLNQALQFHEAIGVTGLAVTKLDGSARGGVLLAVAKRLSLPVRFIGIGEGLDDLVPFDASAYAEALVS